MTASPRANLPRRSIRVGRYRLLPRSFSSFCPNRIRYKETPVDQKLLTWIYRESRVAFLSLSLLVFHSVLFRRVLTLDADTFNAASPATLALIKAKTDAAISAPGSSFLLFPLPQSAFLSLPPRLSFYPSILCRAIRLSLAYPRWSHAFGCRIP